MVDHAVARVRAIEMFRELEKTSMNDALARFVILYLQLDKHQLHRLPEVYADEVLFIDPAHRIEGWPRSPATFPPFMSALPSAASR